MLRRLKDALFPSLEELERRKKELHRRIDDKKVGKGRPSRPGITSATEFPKATGPIELVSAACPYCGVIQEPPPQRRKRCRDCGETIHVHSDRSERKKYLLTANDLERLERGRRDAEWKRLSKLGQEAMRAGDWGSLQGVYQQQASILFVEGRPYRHIALEAGRAKLMQMYELGIPSVKVRSANDERVCEYCDSLDRRVYSIGDALELMPIPGPSCTDGNEQNPHGGRCRCIYIAAIPGVNDG